MITKATLRAAGVCSALVYLYSQINDFYWNKFNFSLSSMYMLESHLQFLCYILVPMLLPAYITVL